MKILILLCSLTCIALNAHSQKTFSINENGSPSVSCDAISVDTQSNIYEFTGNVDFKTADINIEKAQKVILNTKTKKVAVSGNIEYKMGKKRLLINKNCW